MKKDLRNVTIIGALVGLLVEPIADNLLRGSVMLSGFVGSGGLTPQLRAIIFFFFLILAPIALSAAYFLGKLLPVLYQFAKFAAVGTLNTFINFGILNLQSLIFGITSGPWISVFATTSFFLATTNSFFWNKFWTFQSSGNPQAVEAAKFYLITAGGWLLDVAAVYVVVNFFHPGTISPQIWLNIGGLAGVAASFLWNFLGYKYIVFKNPAEKPADNQLYSDP